MLFLPPGAFVTQKGLDQRWKPDQSHSTRPTRQRTVRTEQEAAARRGLECLFPLTLSLLGVEMPQLG